MIHFLFFSRGFHLALLLLILMAAAYTDIRSHKIPNKLILVGMIIGLTYEPSFHGLIGKTAVLLVLFFFGMTGLMGAGDIKLLMVISLFVDVTRFLMILAVAFMLLIIYGLVRYPESRMEFRLMIKGLFLRICPDTKKGRAIPLAPFLLASYLFTLIFTGGGMV